MDTMTRNEITYLWPHAFDRRMRHAISTDIVFAPGEKIAIMYSPELCHPHPMWAAPAQHNWHGSIFSSMVIS